MEINKQEIIERKNVVELDEANAEIIKQKLANIELIGEAIKQSLKEGIDNDYAVIPGCSKPTLLQPGAQKIQLMFGATTEFTENKIDLENKIVTVKATIFVCGKPISQATGICEIQETRRPLGWEMNRAQAIAEKRAYVRATVRIANLSKIFTVDMENEKVENWKDKITKMVMEQSKKLNIPPKQVFELAGINKPMTNEKTYEDLKKYIGEK